MQSAAAPASILIGWKSLTNHLAKWFYKTDNQALACVMATAAAHFYLEVPPVWLFVVGPSSSGKTRICIDGMDGLPNIWPQGDITSKTFISANKAYAGLLSEVGDHGILTFKDFTTILSKREDERGEIAAQLREIYDGKFTKRTGMIQGGTWTGKVTVIAGATMALERAWSIKRELGERFLIVRWPTTSDYRGLKMAASQRGRDTGITADLQKLVAEVVNNRARVLPDLPEDMTDTIAAYSQILARMRGHVYRDHDKTVVDQPVIEDSYRIHKQLCTAAAAHAAIWHRQPQMEDLAIARRLAVDSIPYSRRLIFQSLLPMAPVSTSEIAQSTCLPYTTAEYHVIDLQALGVIQSSKRGALEWEHRIDPDFLDDIKLADLTSPLVTPSV